MFQVYDLAKHSPSAVLQYGLGCLDKMAKSGDECARKTLEKLRILVRLITTHTRDFLRKKFFIVESALIIFHNSKSHWRDE